MAITPATPLTAGVFELVFPARFVDYVSGCDLLATGDPSRDSDGEAVLAAWKSGFMRRRQVVIKVDMDADGRLVTAFFAAYADMVTSCASDFDRGERRAAQLVWDRIVAIRSGYRQVVKGRKESV